MSYEDIINLPHHVSTRHPHMSLHDRAAQFAPFAALTGYGDAIDEEARYTGAKRALSESERNALDEKLRILSEHLEEGPEITVTYFVADERKDGGAYVQETGTLKRIHEYKKLLIFEDGETVDINEILNIDSKLFLRYDV